MGWKRGNRVRPGGTGTAGSSASPSLPVVHWGSYPWVAGCTLGPPHPCVPHDQPWSSGHEQPPWPHVGRGHRFVVLVSDGQSDPLWTGIWPRTPSSVTVTSSGWRTSCAPIPLRRAEPAAPAPGAWPTSASGRSKARSSGAQVAACSSVFRLLRDPVMFPGWLQRGCPRALWSPAGGRGPHTLVLGSNIGAFPLLTY